MVSGSIHAVEIIFMYCGSLGGFIQGIEIEDANSSTGDEADTRDCYKYRMSHAKGSAPLGSSQRSRFDMIHMIQ